LSNREQWYTQVVQNEVLAKHHRALLIMGAFHFVRHFDMMPARKTFDIEEQLRVAAIPVVTEGHGPPKLPLKLKEAADALLYLGPRDSLVTVGMTQAELEGTPYGQETDRRMKLQMAAEN
jgi:hypothetical protein